VLYLFFALLLLVLSVFSFFTCMCSYCLCIYLFLLFTIVASGISTCFPFCPRARSTEYATTYQVSRRFCVLHVISCALVNCYGLLVTFARASYIHTLIYPVCFSFLAILALPPYLLLPLVVFRTDSNVIHVLLSHLKKCSPVVMGNI
jgi:hypothetical protein